MDISAPLHDTIIQNKTDDINNADFNDNQSKDISFLNKKREKDKDNVEENNNDIIIDDNKLDNNQENNNNDININNDNANSIKDNINNNINNEHNNNKEEEKKENMIENISENNIPIELQELIEKTKDNDFLTLDVFNKYREYRRITLYDYP